MANLTPWLDQKFYLADGITPNAGGKVFSYYPGTSTKKTTYVSEDGAANTNPIILNSAGECNLWLADGGYKIVNAPATDTDPPAAAIKTWDNINVNTTGSAEGAGVVDTIADLRNLSEAAFNTVETLGYYSAGDVGSGIYYWDATSTAADNGGTVISPTISDGTGRWILIGDGTTKAAQFGVRGGGVDDTVAIQSAFSAARLVGGDVLFQPGTFICKSQWVIDEFRVVGSGMGSGSAKQTIIEFQELGTNAAVITRLTYTNYSIGISNMRITANSWDITTGCRGYGLDLEAPISLDNLMVYGFYKSNIFYHGGVPSGPIIGGGPYNSVAKNVRSLYSRERGILVGTGANNLTFIECYCAYNGSLSFGVAPTAGAAGVTRGDYKGFEILRDGDGNPGGAYLSYLPESVRVIGGNCSYNGGAGWGFSQTQNSLLEPGYAEGNLDPAYQVVVGNSAITSFINIVSVYGGAAAVNYTNNATNARGSTLWICGRLIGNGANKTNWLTTNLQSILGENADFTKGVYGLWDEALLTYAIAAYGGGKVRLGAVSATQFMENNGTLNRISSFYLGSGNVKIVSGAGTPEGSETADIGSVYPRNDGSGQLYRKASGSGNTGWVQMYGAADNPIFGSGAANAFVSVNGGDGFASDFSFVNSGVELWTLRKESTVVSGGATGSGGAGLELIARQNDQAIIDKPLTLLRAAGSPFLFNRPISVVGNDLSITTLGKGVKIKAGTNGRINLGNVLVAGVVVVANTSVTANTMISWNRVVSGGTLGQITITRSVGVGYTITSSNVLETSTIDVMLTEAT